VTTILGLNAYHADSAACLVRDGELIAAVEDGLIMAHGERI
jgi:carbamoyltransferase